MLKPQDKQRVAIIGAGPAGLSIAKFLQEHPGIETTIFEAESRVGGKSWTFSETGVTCEMGTCYATRADIHARRWFRELGLKTRKLGSASVDGTEYFEWAQQGPGGPLPLEVIRYLLASSRLNRALANRPNDKDVLEEAAMPILDWLRLKKFPRMERLHYRAVTNMGYGRLEETSTIQAIRWVDLALISSGRLNDFLMPTSGWTRLWEELAKDMDVRRSSRVTSVERGETGVHLTARGETHSFDAVVCAIPLDDFAAMTEPTENERFVNTHVRWGSYTTTLMAVKDWFTKESVRSFEAGIMGGARDGKLMSARREAESAELGGTLYVLNQITGDYSPDELVEIATSDISEDGGKPIRAILTKTWKYFAQYSREGVEQGLLQRLERMQGEARTFYTGATFAHEAVSKITKFNARLAPILAAQLGLEARAR